MPITSRVRCEVWPDRPKHGMEGGTLDESLNWTTVAVCSSSEPNVILAILETFELRVHKGKAQCWFRPNAEDDEQPELEVTWEEGKGPCITYVDVDNYGKNVTQSIRDFMVNGV